MILPQHIRHFLLDLDGTFYLEDKLLPGAPDFLAACGRRGIGHTFLTNNSSRSGEDYVAKLRALGVPATRQEVLTSGDATLDWLAGHHAGRDLLLIGTPSLEKQFEDAGYRLHGGAPTAVVAGFDTTLTYDKLVALCDAVRAGLPYIATHPDRNCPVRGGLIPDLGSIIALVEAATGRVPDVIIGKPFGTMAQAAANRAGVPLSALCMVGDRLETDIAMGRCGVTTALVLSGVTDRAALAQSEFCPDYVFEGIGEMAQAL